MITGVGIDIVEVGRIAAAVSRHKERFVERLFTAAEQADAGPEGPVRNQRLAARFAAKEAALKALGIGLRGVKWTDMEIVKDPMGKPTLRLSGKLAEVARASCVSALHVSLSHTREYAIAQVVAVQ